MSTPPIISVDRKSARSSASKSSNVVPFAWGLITGVLLTQVVVVILYALGIIGLAAIQVAQPTADALNPGEFLHRFNRLAGEATPETSSDGSMAPMFAISTIFLKVSGRKGTHPDVVLAVSRAHNTLLSFADSDISDDLSDPKARRLLSRLDADFKDVVSLIKKHEPALAAELANDVQTAVHFR